MERSTAELAPFFGAPTRTDGSYLNITISADTHRQARLHAHRHTHSVFVLAGLSHGQNECTGFKVQQLIKKHSLILQQLPKM